MASKMCLYEDLNIAKKRDHQNCGKALVSTILEGKVAIVTGGARNVGESIARIFAKHGAKVVIADALDELAQSVCQDISPEIASFFHCDVTNELDIKNAIDTTIAKHGKLDVMINNAAIIDGPKISILDVDKSEFETVISVNLTRVFLGTKHAARVMIPARRGSIVSIGSVACSVGGVSTHAFVSSKHAVVGLTKNVAAELGQFGIRVNCLSPYVIVTEQMKKFNRMENEGGSGVYSNLKGVTLGMEDVAEAAVFLASDESKYVSGHNLALDGGFTVINPAFGLFSRLINVFSI
ncbi:borneol dehydrogenase, mitochondrial-like [Cornus florida]|uniref:borneol dehydrogenase, mitochondrial-like n=1 Tax=Cornus florida TaxID=4283 RepID=UPI00289CD061|nr:borneol dehydrogenase, mitochondrial-like [Cornus florida]